MADITIAIDESAMQVVADAAHHVPTATGVSSELQLSTNSTNRRSSATIAMSPSEAEKETLADRNNTRMGNQWGKVMKKEFGTPDHYSKVSVLIVCWAKELDKTLRCEPEVHQLHDLFRDRFNYQSSVVKLDTRRRPQAQLNAAISAFIAENDGPYRSHLLIVYYSGHGYTEPVNGREVLHWSGQQELREDGEDYYPATIEWPKAERDLADAEADVLTIMDCCSAGTIMKSTAGYGRAYEHLAATGHARTTPRPGNNSYTSSLISALVEGLDEYETSKRGPFNTYYLNLKIQEKRGWKQGPLLLNGDGNRITRHIILAPLAQPTPKPLTVLKPTGILTLQVAFQDKVDLTEEEIKKLATEMSKAAKKAEIGIGAITWAGFVPKKDSPEFKRTVMIFHHAWLMIGAMCRQRLKLEKAAQAFAEAGANAKHSRSKSIGLKRGHEGEQGDAPSTKRTQHDQAASPGHLVTPSDVGHSDMPLTPSVSSNAATPSEM